MALNDLTLSLTQGVRARAFEAEIEGLTTGLVEALSDKGAPGFAVINGKARHEALPYQPSAVVLREREPGKGYHDSRIIIAAAEQGELQAQAEALIGEDRTLVRWWVDPVRDGGTLRWYVRAEDDLGATYIEAVGDDTPPTPAPTWSVAPSISPATGPWRVGDLLTGNDGTVINGTVTARAWLRDGTPISGATGGGYLLTEDDLAADIAFRPTATGAGGSASANSASVGPIEAAQVDPTTAALIYDPDTESYTVTNADAFPGATWAWEDEDETTISGQTGATLARADAPAGKAVRAIANDDPATASNWCICPLDMMLLDETFAGAEDNTLLDGWNGWNAYVSWSGNALDSDPGMALIDDAAYLVSKSGSGSAVWQKPVPGLTGPFVLTVWDYKNEAAVNDYLKYHRPFVVGWGPSVRQNFLTLTTFINQGVVCSETVAGTPSQLVSNYSQLNSATSVRYIWDGAKLRVYGLVAGVWTEIADSASNGGYATTISSFDTPSIYFAPPIGNLDAATAPHKMLERVTIEALPAVNFILDSFAEGVVSGTCPADVTVYDWSLADADGRLWTDWNIDVPVDSAGNWSITPTIPPELQGQKLIVVIRTTDENSLNLLDAGLVPITPVIPAYVHGVNEHFINDYDNMNRDRNYFALADARLTDLGGSASYMINHPIEDTGLDENGQFHDLPSGQTKINWAISSAARGKTVEITYPAGLTGKFILLNDVTVLDAPAGGYARIAVGPASNGAFELTIPSGQMPPEGIGTANVTMFDEDETDKTSLLSDAFKAHMVAGNYRAYRNMAQDIAGRTGLGMFTGLVNRGANSVGLLSPKAWGEISRIGDGIDLHVCVPHLADENWIEDYAAALRDEGSINPASKLLVENSNEVWNSAGYYQRQFDWHMFEGCKRGYFAESGPFVPIPGLLRSLDSDEPVKNSIVDRSTGALKQPLAAGDYVLFAKTSVGWVLMKTDIARDIDDIVPTTSGGDWLLIADNTATGLAQRRMYSERSELIFDIFDSVFGKAKIKPVISWQHATGFAAAKPILDFGNLRAKMVGRGILMTAPYWGHNFGRINTSTDPLPWPGNATFYPGWGPTDRGLLLTDTAAFKTAFFEAAEGVVNATVDSDVAYRDALDQWLVDHGELVGSIAKGSYEINWHATFDSGWPVEMKAVYAEIIRDARMGDLVDLQARRTRDEIGGYQMYFHRGGRIPADFTLQYWGMAETELDIGSDNHRFTALAAVGAGA